MNIIKKAWKALCCFFAGCLATMDSPGTLKRARPVTNTQKLEAATEALRKIECLTHEPMILSVESFEKVHEIAQQGWREATANAK